MFFFLVFLAIGTIIKVAKLENKPEDGGPFILLELLIYLPNTPLQLAKSLANQMTLENIIYTQNTVYQNEPRHSMFNIIM